MSKSMGEPIEKTILQQMKRLEKTSDDVKPEKRKESDTSESLELDFRCSATKKEFMILLERKHPDPVYRVVEIAKKDAVSHPGSSLPRAAKALDINVNEIEYDRLNCPYCGGRAETGWRFIRCGKCGMLSCAGGLRKDMGKYHHTCPWCGNEGYVRLIESGKVTGKTGNIRGTRPGEDAGNLLPPA